jgi:hypothetical protein
MFQLLRGELLTSIQGVSLGVGQFVPKLLFALILVALGWVFGSAVGRVVAQLVNSTKLDEALAKTGVSQVISKSGYSLNSGYFLGWLAKAFFIIVFLIPAFEVLGIGEINEFLKTVLMYIPNVVVAALMLFFASIAADIVGSIVSGTSKSMGVHVAHLLGTITRWAIWVFAIIVALSQLGIAREYMQLLFTGFVAMVALAGGLAFGLGGKDAAAEMIKDLRHEIREGKK